MVQAVEGPDDDFIRRRLYRHYRANSCSFRSANSWLCRGFYPLQSRVWARKTGRQDCRANPILGRVRSRAGGPTVIVEEVEVTTSIRRSSIVYMVSQ